MMNMMENQNGVYVIALTGRLDAAGIRPVEADLVNVIQNHHARLVLDLSDTRYISSNGLRVMVRAQKDAEQQGGMLKLCGLSERLKEIFEMAGFDKVFEIYQTRDEAVKSFGA